MEKLDFGKKFTDVRKAKGLTQEEVAEKCKITVRTIQRIESGLVKPIKHKYRENVVNKTMSIFGYFLT